MTLSIRDKLHMVHRCWRLRFKSEAPSIKYVREGRFAGTTVLDIGANKGVFSIYMSRAAGPNGRLIAFEAQPELGQHLSAVKESFGLDNMTLVNQGLSSQPGTLTMHRPEAGSGMASFEFEDGDNLESIEIPVIRLDDYIKSNDVATVSFIKCDVEGHELPVFQGGEKLLRRDMPALLFECHDAEAEDGELFDYLTGLGYDGWFFHVTPEDHSSLFNKARGKFVHFSEFANLSHVKPGIHHRNYVFVRKGTAP
ncbi:MAG: FkbM family methyltransferase [Pseudomonadota bacterium]